MDNNIKSFYMGNTRLYGKIEPVGGDCGNGCFEKLGIEQKINNIYVSVDGHRQDVCGKQGHMSTTGVGVGFGHQFTKQASYNLNVTQQFHKFPGGGKQTNTGVGVGFKYNFK